MVQVSWSAGLTFDDGDHALATRGANGHQTATRALCSSILASVAMMRPPGGGKGVVNNQASRRSR